MKIIEIRMGKEYVGKRPKAPTRKVIDFVFGEHVNHYVSGHYHFWIEYLIYQVEKSGKKLYRATTHKSFAKWAKKETL